MSASAVDKDFTRGVVEEGHRPECRGGFAHQMSPPHLRSPSCPHCLLPAPPGPNSTFHQGFPTSFQPVGSILGPFHNLQPASSSLPPLSKALSQCPTAPDHPQPAPVTTLPVQTALYNPLNPFQKCIFSPPLPLRPPTFYPTITKLYSLNSVGEAYDGDFTFAESLEAFGAGQDDPLSVAIGGFQFFLPISASVFPSLSRIVFFPPSLFCRPNSPRLHQRLHHHVSIVAPFAARISSTADGFSAANDSFSVPSSSSVPIWCRIPHAVKRLPLPTSLVLLGDCMK
ncbi:ADP-ribosylation factor GTPase-activating protein AGD2 [Platanthera guangdongensis]|uniref:ADP-ribosylation factor GTPase-activating protein AGD2 n=1 Tax=Platanthera guangdongensis TaxID=2320717 RepID=A0ABR2MPY9_9ASPA